MYLIVRVTCVHSLLIRQDFLVFQKWKKNQLCVNNGRKVSIDFITVLYLKINPYRSKWKTLSVFQVPLTDLRNVRSLVSINAVTNSSRFANQSIFVPAVFGDFWRIIKSFQFCLSSNILFANWSQGCPVFYGLCSGVRHDMSVRFEISWIEWECSVFRPVKKQLIRWMRIHQYDLITWSTKAQRIRRC
jgi:hypothetical protein